MTLNKRVAAALLAIFIGPLVYGLYQSWGQPLWATKTVYVAQTHNYGVIPTLMDYSPISAIALMVALAGLIITVGPRP